MSLYREKSSGMSCWYTRTIYTAHLIMCCHRCAMDTLTDQQQSFLIFSLTSMQQATDMSQSAAVNRLILSWTGNVISYLSLYTDTRKWTNFFCDKIPFDEDSSSHLRVWTHDRHRHTYSHRHNWSPNLTPWLPSMWYKESRGNGSK